MTLPKMYSAVMHIFLPSQGVKDIPNGAFLWCAATFFNCIFVIYATTFKLHNFQIKSRKFLHFALISLMNITVFLVQILSKVE